MVATRRGRGSAATRVAIVGGGCAGLTAAWELAQQEDSLGNPAFEITVYEKSWVLGGKGSSVRDANQRILEHGLHVWMGFYENAFRLMRECYSTLENEGPYDSVDAAFFPESHLGAALKDRTGAWQAWTGEFPPAPGEPGTDIDAASNPFSLASYVGRLLDMVKTLILSVIEAPASGAAADRRRHWGYSGRVAVVEQDSPIRARPDSRSKLDAELSTAAEAGPSASADVLVERLANLVRVGALTTGAALVQALAIFETILQQSTSLMPQQSRVLDLLEALVKQARRLFADFVATDENIRRRTEIIDLVMTIIVGLYRDKVIVAPNGLEAIDDIDCREWLIRHGATYTAVNSPFVRGLYDMAFAYRDGDKRHPALAAGQALRGALRMFFTYRGAIVWRMRAGMGDVVFSPLYRALVKRGVHFEFNCELTQVDFSDLSEGAGNRVTGLGFRQSHRPSGGKQWTPLEDFGWPDSPDRRFTRLARPRALSLKADAPGNNGFDAVVLALGKDDFVRTCSDLCRDLDRFGKMRDHVATVATQATQFWLGADFAQLGWSRGPVVLTGLDGPLDSWADMTHTLAAEKPPMRGRYRPRAVAYLCGVMEEAKLLRGGDDEARQAAALDLVKSNGRQFLHDSGAMGELVAPGAGNAFAQQHFRANVNRSDRYTLAMPGTLKHRVSPLDDSVENMTVAGDWTDCGFNEGCVEAAVMSGRLAAHALTGDRPTLDEIIGFNHP